MYAISQIQDYMNAMKLDKSPSTVRSYDLAIRKFCDFLKIETFENLVGVTPANIREFQTKLIANKSGDELDKAKNTANAYFRPLKAMFNWFIVQEYLDKSPFNKVKLLKVDKKEPTYITDEEVSAMISSCKKVDDLIILSLLLTTGLRREELTTLKLSSVLNNHILVDGKGSKEAWLQLQPRVVEELNKYLEYRNKKYGNKTEYLLVSKMGCKYSGNSIRARIQTIGERAGIPEERLKMIHTHSTRHTFCKNMFASGASTRVVQGAMRHANIQTTMIYAHMGDDTLDNAILNQKSIFN